MIDLRDDALDLLELTRGELVATTAAHYECTREWARHLALRSVGRAQTHGMVWRSRVAELARADHPILDDLLAGAAGEVAMIIGTGQRGDQLHQWRRGSGLRHHETLHEGQGRALVEHLATTYLDASIIDT